MSNKVNYISIYTQITKPLDIDNLHDVSKANMITYAFIFNISKKL